eukprot:TRINITY_DN10558_c0_g1_i1.p1 TRINITY_DN10558_c0_g1~~TRINITY_DN10558_c0_g1_i1.p1  ORF type:complete len:123 (+),score=4.79 TRINITY_DN10558_c0_g1_i1:32-400(+)
MSAQKGGLGRERERELVQCKPHRVGPGTGPGLAAMTVTQSQRRPAGLQGVPDCSSRAALSARGSEAVAGKHAPQQTPSSPTPRPHRNPPVMNRITDDVSLSLGPRPRRAHRVGPGTFPKVKK